ncbi:MULTISPECIES: PoNe immunity protein domain-containing protein [Pseudomonas]|uniref:Membrane protein n=1 Tax=Pseudomonas fulva TaxID=47880 RepID=A0A0D0KVP0_9PSED|nr:MULTISPECIES: PoNe immunity protein domain-containing protein [Pseudomonas]KIQ01240.1 membrane protein [Pseudomonas fulva]
MIRDALARIDYWNDRIVKDYLRLEKRSAMLLAESKNPEYDPQFTFDISKDILRLIFRIYSRGDQVSELKDLYSMLLDMWELSERLSAEICAKHDLNACRSWIFSLSVLNHYNWCFWLVGLALTLDIADDQWQRLLILIGGEGEDSLLDRVIASRQSDRKIGTQLLHPKPYGRLLKAINAPEEQQAVLLRDFVDHWYAELKRKGKDELWWYIYGDPEKHPIEMGSYFGRWCIEAVAAVKAFGLDDSLCLGHEHYPGDLLRPDGPSTHPARVETKSKLGIFARLFGR